ncbi:hypothetical protein C8R45DRAFT_1040787 [Mycena sanguinolenta]|nr:hypothetical protein C8R45DRAFT_1040787 [Mycena sanguinolenta]
MPSTKPHITPPTSTATPSFYLPPRLAHFIADLVFTITCSFVTLVALLYLVSVVMGPSCVTEFSDSSTSGVLRIAAVCTLLGYGVFEGGAVLLRRICRRRRVQDGEYDDYDAIESGAFDDDELDGEGKPSFGLSHNL